MSCITFLNTDLFMNVLDAVSVPYPRQNGFSHFTMISVNSEVLSSNLYCLHTLLAASLEILPALEFLVWIRESTQMVPSRLFWLVSVRMYNGTCLLLHLSHCQGLLYLMLLLTKSLTLALPLNMKRAPSPPPSDLQAENTFVQVKKMFVWDKRKTQCSPHRCNIL